MSNVAPAEQPTRPDRAVNADSKLDRLQEAEPWAEEPEELPRRPRRRLFSPIFIALFAALLVVAGFIAGVQIEKQEAGSSSSAGSAALAGSSAAGGAAPGAGAAAAGGAASLGRGANGGSSPRALSAGAGFTRPTAGTVSFVSGQTLYVTNGEGNTVKVNTSAGTSVSKTVRLTVSAIHPGETVTVTGASGSNGTVSAQSISVGSGEGALRSLFGGAASSSSSRSGAGGGTPQLFGSG